MFGSEKKMGFKLNILRGWKAFKRGGALGSFANDVSLFRNPTESFTIVT
jgi:hypothetical protein